MTIINYALPETGIVELKFEIRVSAETAKQTINSWLLNHVSMQMRALEPQLVIDRQIVWRVHVSLGTVDLGQVGEVGHVDIDVNTGEIIDASAAECELLKSADLVAEQLPPYQPKHAIPAEFLLSSL